MVYDWVVGTAGIDAEAQTPPTPTLTAVTHPASVPWEICTQERPVTLVLDPLPEKPPSTTQSLFTEFVQPDTEEQSITCFFLFLVAHLDSLACWV